MKRPAIDANKVDFLFRYGRFSWRETYWDGVGTSYIDSQAKAKRLAPFRIAMFGNDGTTGGSPYLARIIVSNDAIGGDSDETFDYGATTPEMAATWRGNFAASPEFAMMWRTTNQTGFARTRYLSGIPTSLLGLTSPHLNGTMIGQFAKFKKQLWTDGWAYLLTGAGPNKNPDNRVTFIQPGVGTSVIVWSPVLPNANQKVELRYARFGRNTPPVRGTFVVQEVLQGSFRISFGTEAPNVKYSSGGIWRLPASRLVAFDGSSLMTGVTAHKRGYKTYAERGRSALRRAQVF